MRAAGLGILVAIVALAAPVIATVPLGIADPSANVIVPLPPVHPAPVVASVAVYAPVVPPLRETLREPAWLVVSVPGAPRLKFPPTPETGGALGLQVIVNELFGVIVGLLQLNVCANAVPAESAASATPTVNVRRRRFSSGVCMRVPFSAGGLQYGARKSLIIRILKVFVKPLQEVCTISPEKTL